MPVSLLRPVRRAFLLGLPGALVVALTIGAAQPAEAAPLVRASVSISKRVTHPGDRVTVSGTVRSGASPAARVAVAVEQRTTGTSAWKTLRRTVTSPTGRFAVRTPALTRSTQFRMRVMGAASAAAVSPAASVTVPTKVTVTATSPLISSAGDTVVLAGTTSTQLAGRRIFLQWLHDGTWRSIGSSVVTTESTFNVGGIVTAGGEQSYRATVKAAPGQAQATSDPVEFTVSAWYRLADLTPIGASTGVRTGRAVVAGAAYEQSVAASLQEGEASSVTYRLTSRCSGFRATLGAEDGADAAFSGRWRLLADDGLALEATLQTGAAQQQEARITGADTLRLRTFALQGAGSTAWGNAEVLCVGTP